MYSAEIRRKMADYYEFYYRDTLSIPDWENRVNSRYDEANIEKSRLIRLAKILGLSYDKLNNVLVVGAGTGGALVALKQLGVRNVFAVEPNPEALEICMMKADLCGLDTKLFSRHSAESLPYDNGTFEFVYCFTVLEHVQSIEQALVEMCRVLCPGGTLYVNTPNYNYPYEGHYKIHAPTCFGKLITSIYCFLMGKNVSFIKSLQFVTPYKIKRILYKIEDISFFWLHDSRANNLNNRITGFRSLLARALSILDIEKNQEICVKKISI
ncbi:MAG: class I SAM-dependent methyltransferase [Sulfurimonas sp.]|nr:class I SAM-dependent methyltransferase [Sulfurimonas sp.]